MTSTIQVDMKHLLPTIGTGAMVTMQTEQYVAAMPQMPAAATMYPTQTNFTLNADLALSQQPNFQFFEVARGRVYVVVIDKNHLPETTPRQWLEKRRKWKNPEYRHAYMEAAIEQGVAWQIRINRERRNLSQSALATKIGSKQSAISRAEDESYGRHRLETLAKIANAFDCALQVRFIPYSKLAKASEDLSPEALYVKTYVEEIEE